MKTRIVIQSTALAATACFALAVGGQQKTDMEAQKIREYVKYLASDALEGRGTGQKGGDAAADYIAKQFESFGLKPGAKKELIFRMCRWLA